MPEVHPGLFGRVQVAETPSALLRLHLHDGSALHTASHAPPIGVLDQQDLIAQGIDTSVLIAGAQKVNALGSCTANANTAALSNVLAEDDFLGVTASSSYQDTKGLEEFAIRFYDVCTHQTGEPATEWPPTDCGSSGPYLYSEDHRLGWVSSEKIVSGPESFVSLLQTDGVLVGGSWFFSWMEPNAQGFVDGTGSASSLESAIASGVAGGHERYSWEVESLELTETGRVVPEKTVLIERNSWGRSWGDDGNYRIHLSTHMMLASHSDYRQLVA